MKINRYVSHLFGSPEWYSAIQDTYNFKNQFESDGLFGLQTPFRKTYSFLPFSDWYFEVDNKKELDELENILSSLPCKHSFEARVLIRGNFSTAVSTYRIPRLDAQSRLKVMSNSTRRYTRKSLQNGLILEVSDSSAIDRFFRLHALTRRKLGLPVQPKVFFKNIMKHLPYSKIALCLTPDRCDAAAFFLLKKGTVLYYKYGASDPKLLALRPNHYLYYQLHSIAEKEHLTTIDLGRTDSVGLHHFKSSLGATPISLLKLTHRGPESGGTHEGPRIALIRKILSHFPAGFHVALGKLLYRYLA